MWVALLAAPLVAEQCAALVKQGPAAALQHELEGESPDSGSGSESESSESESSSSDSGSSGSSSSDSSSSDSDAGGSGSDSDGATDGAGGADAGVLRARLRGLAPSRPLSGGELPPEVEARLRYMERYGQVVSDVLDSMLQPLDAATMAQLGRQSKKNVSALVEASTTCGKTRRGRKNWWRQAQAGSLLLPCVVPRAAVDRAAQLLMLEADLRGRPELHALLERSDWPPPGHGGAGAAADAGAGAAAGGEPVLGRHSHHLWQRLERAAGQAEGGAADAAAAAAAAAGGKAGQAGARKRKGKGRVLSAEERLVLGILSDPRFDYAGRTVLP